MTLLTLLAAALVLAGCGGGAGGAPPQASEEGEQASQNDEPKKKDEGFGKPEKATEGSDGRASKKGLGHPALGDADAPVVLTEYSDYQ